MFTTRAPSGLGATARLAWQGFLDLIYPPRCLVCERPARPDLCETCAAQFLPIPEPICGMCGRPCEGDGPCRFCAASPGGGWHFETARAAAVYQGPLREAIHRFKYGPAESLGEPLGAFLANRCVVDGLLTAAVDLAVPVPAQAAHLRERGFNQAALLAAPVAEMLGAPLRADALRRIRRTPPQVGLSAAARRGNLDNVFAAGDADAIAGRSVLLVDDVLTTGTTVNQCAAALKAAGARAVHVVTLAAGG